MFCACEIVGKVAIILTLVSPLIATPILDKSGNVELTYQPTTNGIDIQISKNGVFKSTLKIGQGRNLVDASCKGTSCSLGSNEKLTISPLTNRFNITWTVEAIDGISMETCVDLHSSNTNWFGGPERYNQVWPLEKMVLNGSEPYVIKKSDNFAVAERYWLSSKGVYYIFDDIVPLWVDQNIENSDQVCFKAEVKAPYINRWRIVSSCIVGIFDDPKVAHLDAINFYLGKPTTHPNEKMISQSIWTTWAKYKRDITQDTVLEFAKEIRSHGYQGGQLEIDDKWERCYGAQEFDSSKFGGIKDVVDTLHNDSWRITLWIHPFVNDDCQNNSAIGQEKGYFVKNPQGDDAAQWWISDNAHQIDFTNQEAAQWWVARLKRIQDEVGIDSFKFDAGESDYANQPNVYSDVEHTPNILTEDYIRTCSQFGDLIEYRAGFRAQKYGKFIRMIDKDSGWGLNNGLASLITTLLQLNMNGYGMVLPDMIGGNEYYYHPTAELLVRWTQANTFMPTMQFSFLPWDFDNETSFDTEAIVKKYVDLHEQYAPNIVRAMERNIEDGSPVNAPIWWIDPSDSVALASDDEYLVGDEVLVAPVIVEGATSRTVYLPLGQWKDGNNGTTYMGPVYLRDYPAPIDVLPYFIRQ